MIYHVRRPKRRARGRRGYSAGHFSRVSGAGVSASTLCGADVTAYDILPRDFREGETSFGERTLCPACISNLEEVRC